MGFGPQVQIELGLDATKVTTGLAQAEAATARAGRNMGDKLGSEAGEAFGRAFHRKFGLQHAFLGLFASMVGNIEKLADSLAGAWVAARWKG